MMDLSLYTIGFGVAVREIATGETAIEAQMTASDLNEDEFNQYVHGYLAAYALNRQLDDTLNNGRSLN